MFINFLKNWANSENLDNLYDESIFLFILEALISYCLFPMILIFVVFACLLFIPKIFYTFLVLIFIQWVITELFNKKGD